jgi:dihydrolipoamide dehydrogenase
MGRAAGRAAAGIEAARFVPEHVPRVACTTPEIAQVGMTADAAAGREVVLHTLRLEETLAGHLAHIGERPETKGLVRLVCASDDGRLLGATAMGPGAAEAVGAAALALAVGATESSLADGATATPSALEAVVRAVR